MPRWTAGERASNRTSPLRFSSRNFTRGDSLSGSVQESRNRRVSGSSRASSTHTSLSSFPSPLLNHRDSIPFFPSLSFYLSPSFSASFFSPLRAKHHRPPSSISPRKLRLANSIVPIFCSFFFFWFSFFVQPCAVWERKKKEKTGEDGTKKWLHIVIASRHVDTVGCVL